MGCRVHNCTCWVSRTMYHVILDQVHCSQVTNGQRSQLQEHHGYAGLGRSTMQPLYSACSEVVHHRHSCRVQTCHGGCVCQHNASHCQGEHCNISLSLCRPCTPSTYPKYMQDPACPDSTPSSHGQSPAGQPHLGRASISRASTTPPGSVQHSLHTVLLVGTRVQVEHGGHHGLVVRDQHVQGAVVGLLQACRAPPQDAVRPGWRASLLLLSCPDHRSPSDVSTPGLMNTAAEARDHGCREPHQMVSTRVRIKLCVHAGGLEAQRPLSLLRLAAGLVMPARAGYSQHHTLQDIDRALPRTPSIRLWRILVHECAEWPQMASRASR